MGYPIHLVGLERRLVLVVGGGNVAASKTEALLEAGARVVVIAPRLSEAMERLVPRLVRVETRTVVSGDLEGVSLVIAATDDPRANAELAARARERGILVNAVDDPQACDFYAPAVVRRGAVSIAFSTDGGSPLLAAQLRRLAEAVIPRSVGEVAELFVEIRKRGLRGIARRSKLLRALTDPGVTRLVDGGRNEEAAQRLEAIVSEAEEPFPAGSVSLVGAGPGGRGLLTLRALDRIQRADAILHDALVDDEVLALALPGARRVNVGRRCRQTKPDASDLRFPQSMTTSLMIHEARSGARVVRLHAGDPFVFGRGGEELAALEEAEVPYEIVPGVSAALAAPAAAGIPLTQRGEARGFSVRTGHTRAGYSRAELPADEETVVVLMGLGGIEEIMRGLLEEGRSPDTPAVAVSCAARASERIVKGTIETLPGLVAAARIEAPATLIVGKLAGRARASCEQAVAGAHHAA